MITNIANFMDWNKNGAMNKCEIDTNACLCINDYSLLSLSKIMDHISAAGFETI